MSEFGPRLALVLVLAVGSIGLAACGGGDDSSSSAATTGGARRLVCDPALERRFNLERRFTQRGLRR